MGNGVQTIQLHSYTLLCLMPKNVLDTKWLAHNTGIQCKHTYSSYSRCPFLSLQKKNKNKNATLIPSIKHRAESTRARIENARKDQPMLYEYDLPTHYYCYNVSPHTQYTRRALQTKHIKIYTYICIKLNIKALYEMPGRGRDRENGLAAKKWQ